jgi:Rieske Fe-S protein
MTALAAALAACGLSNTPTAPGSLSQPVTITLSEHPSLANVDGVAFVSDTDGNPLALVRTGTSTFVALSRICPHAGSTVNTASFGFLCPGHGAEFDFSGRWMGGQRTSSLTSYPTQYNAAAGTVAIG